MNTWTQPRFSEFASINELLADIEASPPSDQHSRRSAEHNSCDGGDWTPHGYADTVRIARDGWPDGLARLDAAKKTADLVLAAATETRPKRRYDIAGAFPHAPRAAAGEPLNMINIGKERGRRKVYRMFLNINHVNFVSGQQIANYGAAILAQVDMMEASGTRCEINVVYDLQHREREHNEAFILTAKDADQPIELDKLAFCFINSGLQRRLGFRWSEHSPHCPGGYGSCYNSLAHNQIKQIKEIMFPAMTPDNNNTKRCKTPEDASAYVAGIITAYEAQQAQHAAQEADA